MNATSAVIPEAPNTASDRLLFITNCDCSICLLMVKLSEANNYRQNPERLYLFQSMRPMVFKKTLIFNRSPTKAVRNQTSLKTWYKQKREVSHLKVF